MEFNVPSCFGDLPSLASPLGWGAETIDLSSFGDVFRIEDLSEFSNEEIAGPIPSEPTLSSASSETVPQHGIWTSSFPSEDFTLCPPLYEGTGLEWMSGFVEDSFTGRSNLGSFADSSNITDEKQIAEPEPEAGGRMNWNPLDLKKERAVPGRARSKRSRAGSFRGWSYEDHRNGQAEESVKVRRAEGGAQVQQPRRCTHCLSQRTPQWRAGPLGPKTLCNACGVRFKSGRLYPEYRPAKSPTFVNSIHSNSHKKVLEMRSDFNGGQQQQQQPPLKVKIKISTSSPGLDELSSGSN
ncbi:hypothetical protein SUGI_0322100 [Cryptomeria japonica]|nr:hypothetical protein SUGI_0322100 [Cryptomeria japonica]